MEVTWETGRTGLACYDPKHKMVLQEDHRLPAQGRGAEPRVCWRGHLDRQAKEWELLQELRRQARWRRRGARPRGGEQRTRRSTQWPSSWSGASTGARRSRAPGPARVRANTSPVVLQLEARWWTSAICPESRRVRARQDLGGARRPLPGARAVRLHRRAHQPGAEPGRGRRPGQV